MVENKQPQQHEPLLCQTLNSNGRKYNKNNMNHSCQTLESNDRQ